MGVGLLHSAGGSPFCLKPCVSAPAITNYGELDLVPNGLRVCCLVHAAGDPVQVSVSIIACVHWIPCKGGIRFHCIVFRPLQCLARPQSANLQWYIWLDLLRNEIH